MWHIVENFEVFLLSLNIKNAAAIFVLWYNDC